MYPILSLVVKDISACLMPTVRCEPTFGAGGNIINATHSQLLIPNVEIKFAWKIEIVLKFNNKNQRWEIQKLVTVFSLIT